ncbi:pre-mycofactocin synthase MftD [Dietzia timorensis]|uniref:Putative mycofactocin system heme/flavin oxidoreductase MftD n=1 Tax=Dietzia timorensis TaxID=499555 RepID=A0A173LN84_9ACTN|nr:pre-mycofactocin synthase MftD [Dietzia timorensis]ANI93099.1 Putative mycofactocin system heme/flavin oxidoreductase MftD [Dietzia timorensis]
MASLSELAELNPWRKNPWFESVAEAQRRAKKKLPKSVYMALIAGSERGLTRDDNTDAFGELGFKPHVVGAKAERSMETSVMGQPISFPVMISPTGVQAVTPDGEVDVARAAAARGTAMGLSSFASKPIEEVAAVNPQTFFQVYWLGGKEEVLARLERAKAAGAKGVIITTDWSFSIGRDWGSPEIPEKLDAKAMVKLAPELAVRPRWVTEWAKSVIENKAMPDLTTPNLVAPGEVGPTFFGAYGEWQGTPPPTWEDIAWIARNFDGPVMLKGITRVDDAKRAVDAGVTAISVSNHGGNNLDGTPASIRCLAPIVDAVGGDVEVVLDGGIRRGGDVAKALALGARAVMIGRAYLWGLGANGQTGVENVLDLLRMGLDSALIGTGKSSISELSRDDLIIPEDFFRRLGE